MRAVGGWQAILMENVFKIKQVLLMVSDGLIDKSEANSIFSLYGKYITLFFFIISTFWAIL